MSKSHWLIFDVHTNHMTTRLTREQRGGGDPLPQYVLLRASKKQTPRPRAASARHCLTMLSVTYSTSATPGNFSTMTASAFCIEYNCFNLEPSSSKSTLGFPCSTIFPRSSTIATSKSITVSIWCVMHTTVLSAKVSKTARCNCDWISTSPL